MSEYIIDEKGKWLLRKGKKYALVDPSQEYLDSQKPTKEEKIKQKKQELEKEYKNINLFELLISKGVLKENDLSQKIIELKQEIQELKGE